MENGVKELEEKLKKLEERVDKLEKTAEKHKNKINELVKENNKHDNTERLGDLW